MRGILLTTVALLALGTTSAFAGSFNFALPVQVGALQAVSIDQKHANFSTAVTGQFGVGQAASVQQGSKHNTVWGDNAGILQVGGLQAAAINQQGSHDNAGIVQLGVAQSASLSQSGTHDTAVIVQAGVGQYASVKQ